MSYHEPISIQATFTDTNGDSIEKQFRSLNQAAKFFKLSVQTMKDLSLGVPPKTHQPMPKDLKVIQIPLLPKPPKVPKQPKQPKSKPKPKPIIKNEPWHCDICNRTIKSKSKYAHVMTASHLKLKNLEQQPTPNDTNELNKTNVTTLP